MPHAGELESFPDPQQQVEGIIDVVQSLIDVGDLDPDNLPR